jgi:diguanylate cyclase (GGDEF)-like protein
MFSLLWPARQGVSDGDFTPRQDNTVTNRKSDLDLDSLSPTALVPRPSRESVVRVLLVEESSVETEFLKGLLSKAYFTNYHVTRVRSLSEVILLLEEDRFDVLLIDLKRTVDPGRQTLRQVQSRTAEIGLPIVVMTETEEESLALEAPGCDTPEYLIRGEFQARTLIRTIQQATDRQRMLIRLQAAHERELYLSTHDQLTGLPNRYLFADRLAQALHTSRRHGTWLGVLFLDIDRFNAVNETLGHSGGDQLLKVVARRLLSCLRATDTTARVGGDSFAVMLPALTQGLDAGKVAQNIERSLDNPLRLGGRELRITSSIGIAIYPDDGNDAETLMNCAEAALKSAKAAGGSTRRFYTSEMNTTSLRSLSLENDLRRALTLEQDQFIIEFQPIVDGSTGQIESAEALMRWKHPELGIISPTEFIPIAESRGLIIPLGAWVLRGVCQQIRRWRDAGYSPIPISVNVSPIQFWHADFLGLAMQTLLDTGVPGKLLRFEITEGSVMREISLVGEALNAVQQLDVQTAIDDFGTGFSSLNVLRQLPLDILKIDRSFVAECAEDSSGSAITKAIIALAKSLGLGVVAEGVETEEQRSFLLQHDCLSMQGFFFSHPLPVDRLTRVIAAGDTLPLAVE